MGPVPSDPRPRPLSWAVWARAARYFLATCGALVLLNALLYRRDIAAERQLMETVGHRIAQTQTRILRRELSGLRSDLLYLSRHPALHQRLRQGGPALDFDAQYQRFGQNRRYDQIRVLDEAGREFTRVERQGDGFAIVPKSGLQSKADRYYYLGAQTLGPNEVFLSSLDLNIEHGEVQRPWKPVIRGVAAVRDPAGSRVGMVVLNYLGQDLLDELSAATDDGPGQAYLVDAQGYYVVGPGPDKSWGFMFDKAPTFAEDFPDAWRQVSDAESGQFNSASGLFSVQRVRAPMNRDSKASAPLSHEFDLRVVHFIPKATLSAASGQTLRRTAAISGLAALPIFLLLLYLAYGSVVRRAHELHIEASEARLRTLSEKLLSAQEDERRVIARNLHDDLGQHTTVIMLELQRALHAKSPGNKEKIIQGAITSTEQLLTRLHDVITSIRPTILDDLGLRAALTAYFEQYQERFKVTVSHDLKFDDEALTTRLADNMYRIVQEALVNTATHAQVDKVFVQLHHEREMLDLLVIDRGRGFDPDAATQRLGVVGMQERAELLGGHFGVLSAPGQGTEILVSIPAPMHP